MNNTQETALKIRFRLSSGEEFEAEGPREFIDTERAKFLALINQPHAVSQQQPALTPVTQPQAETTHSGHSELYFWEKLLKEDGATLVLRRKTKWTAQETALVLLAGARVLLKQPAYPALELARSLTACGVTEGRLDRLLASEIQAGRIVGEGIKRSRTYQLTHEGFARAFVLAEKLLKELKPTSF